MAGRSVYAYRFELRLSHTRVRGEGVVSTRRPTRVAPVHNEGFPRLGGVAATVRVDSCKTAVSRGAEAWGESNPSYQRYARAVGSTAMPARCGIRSRRPKPSAASDPTALGAR